MDDQVGDVVDQAIAWHLRLGVASTADWRRFVDWIEADPAHAAAYERIALDDALLSPTLDLDETPCPANDASPPRRLALAGGGALAAAIVAALVIPAERPLPASRYAIETPPGRSRSLTLPDGTTIALNGGGRLMLDHDDPRYAMLDRGEAVFTVVHDARHPFALHAGDSTIRDLGTTFDVTRDGPSLGVQVAEGAVMVAGAATARPAVTLTSGMAFAVRDGSARAVVSRVAPASVGSWQHGLLSFRETPVGAVARAIERSTGARMTVGKDLAGRPFTGTIHLSGGADQLVPRVAALVDAHWRRDGDGWLLYSRSDDLR